MDMGKLRHRFTIQNQTSSVDSYGETLYTYTDNGYVWSGFEQASGSETEQGKRIVAQNHYTIRTRYTPLIAATTRLLLGDRVFNISSYFDVEERHRELLITAVEQAATVPAVSVALTATATLAADGAVS